MIISSQYWPASFQLDNDLSFEEDDGFSFLMDHPEVPSDVASSMYALEVAAKDSACSIYSDDPPDEDYVNEDYVDDDSQSLVDALGDTIYTTDALDSDDAFWPEVILSEEVRSLEDPEVWNEDEASIAQGEACKTSNYGLDVYGYSSIQPPSWAAATAPSCITLDSDTEDACADDVYQMDCNVEFDELWQEGL